MPKTIAIEITKYNAIHAAITQAAKGRDVISWGDIAAAVSAAVPIRSNGWTPVRAVLQAIIDEGDMIRTLDVRKEEYFTTLLGRRVFWDEAREIRSGVVASRLGPALAIREDDGLVSHKGARAIRLYYDMESLISGRIC